MDHRIGVAEITDGDVLANVKAEVATSRGQHECAGDRGRPYDLILDEPLHVLEDRVSVVASLGKLCISIRTEQHRVWAVDADETQPAQALGDGLRIFAHVSGQSHDWIAGSLTDATNAGGGKAIEDSAIFSEGDPSRCSLCRLPVRVVGTTVHIVDRLAIKLERNAQLH